MSIFVSSLGENTEPQPLYETSELHALAKKYGDSLQHDMADQGFVVENHNFLVGDSVSVKSILKNRSEQTIVTLTVQFSPEKFFLSHIHTEKDFRKQGHAERLFAWMSNFLGHQKQNYGFSMSGFSETTAGYARKYFDVLSERGRKIRGKVRPIISDASED